MQVSAVVPVYNSEASLATLVGQLADVLAESATDYEIVLVDDRSADGSWVQILELADRHPGVVGVRLARNVGEQSALLCGIRSARFEVIVTLDDDLQHPPTEIPVLLRELAEGPDLVYGVPVQMHQSRSRRLAAHTGKWVAASLLDAPDARSVSSFRAFRTPLRDAFEAGPSQAVFVDEMLRWGSTRVSSVPVRHAPRATGRSNYRLSSLIEHTVDMYANYSIRPLRLASAMGSILLAAAPVLAIAGVARRADGNLGTWLVASFVALVGAAILLALGIVGEYLGRVFERSSNQPAYVVAAVHPPSHPSWSPRSGPGDPSSSDATGERGRHHIPRAGS